MLRPDVKPRPVGDQEGAYGQTAILLSYVNGPFHLSSKATRTPRRRGACVFRSSFVNDMVRLKRESGSLAPKRQGNPGRGKLTGVKGWVERRITAQPDLTIDELTAEAGRGARGGRCIARPSAGCCSASGCHTKKSTCKRLSRSARTWPTCAASGIGKTPALHGQPSGKTGLHRRDPRSRPTWPMTTGWAPRGQRLVDHAPFGHWRTQTFIGALRHDRLDAPWVIDGAMKQ